MHISWLTYLILSTNCCHLWVQTSKNKLVLLTFTNFLVWMLNDWLTVYLDVPTNIFLFFFLRALISKLLLAISCWDDHLKLKLMSNPQQLYKHAETGKRAYLSFPCKWLADCWNRLNKPKSNMLSRIFSLEKLSVIVNSQLVHLRGIKKAKNAYLWNLEISIFCWK